MSVAHRSAAEVLADGLTDAVTLRLGIVGHRPNRLPAGVEAALGDRIGLVLDRLRRELMDRCSGKLPRRPRPTLVVINALAEGSDRIAARVALDRGMVTGIGGSRAIVLDVMLPAPPNRYAAGFEAESRREYWALLRQARSVQVIAAARDGPAAEAFGATACAIIARSDLLLAVWDCGSSAGPGGTTESVHLALDAGLPVIHVNPHSLETVIGWSSHAAPTGHDRPGRWLAFDAAIVTVMRELVAARVGR